jgi:predicted SAM-dependent methyltransferase
VNILLRNFKSKIKKLIGSIRIRWELLRSGDTLKIIVGSANTAQAGWLSTDYPVLDLTNEGSFSRLLKTDSVDTFLAEHVWEHLHPTDAQNAIHNCYRHLKRGGRLRIAVPDGLHSDPDYIAQVKPGGYGSGADDHKVLYDFRSLSAMLEAAGFHVKLLEWFDEQGKFHFEPWQADDGMIKRSTRYDPRNSDHPTTFTSLIVDGIKP